MALTMPRTARQWLDQLQAQPPLEPLRIMNVCGGHERSITQAGLRSLLPPNITLIPGPGCPVCVCPEEDIRHAITLAQHYPITLVTFGDMLRVPVNNPKSQPRSLEQAKAQGADIRPIASPTEAVRLARAQPQRSVIFFAAGFETTMAPVAAMVAEGIPANLFLLLSGRRTWPAVAMLLELPNRALHALIAPGHVATVMGSDEWQFVVEQYQLPAAVAGFSAESLLAAFYSVVRQQQSGQLFLDNCYAELVTPAGNRRGQQWLNQVLAITDAHWRGIGTIPQSGFTLRPNYQAHDARLQFEVALPDPPQRGEMPPGCDCAAVILGQKLPNECRLYGTACQPRTPIGPCMVSDEGACHIWWAGGLRQAPPQRTE